jgi:hypothetical protein
MRKRINLLLILVFLALAVAAQQKVRKTDNAQHQAEEAQRRAQAVDILKGLSKAPRTFGRRKRA